MARKASIHRLILRTRSQHCSRQPRSRRRLTGLALNYEFARYIFVTSLKVLSCLKKRLAGHPKFSQIVFIEGDCNEVIEEVRFASPADHLMLAFIDPTGLQIRFRTIQRLVQNRSVDRTL